MEEWQVVNRRRRRFPQNWTTTTNPQPTQVMPQPTLAKPYVPFTNTPTYAQVLRRNTPSPPGSSHANTSLRTPSLSPPASPTSPTSTAFYRSPHSPTNLRFPPSSRFQEWKGRCFRCCRRGHTKALCRNHIKCGKCWKEGHVGNHCKTPALNPSAVPFRPIKAPHQSVQVKGEPFFDDLLTGTVPTVPPLMPEERPNKVLCYIPRDEVHFGELEKLERGVVFHSNLDREITTDLVAAYAARTGLLRAEEVSVAVLTGGRYLIMLPHGMAPETFIRATPCDLWDLGYSFQPWSPHEGAAIVIPSYKVLVHLAGLPLHLWREEDVIKVVTSFGTYLGSIANQNPASLKHWAAVVATEDLAQIPHYVSIRVGGLEYTVEVRPIKWVHNLIYRPADLPPPPRTFSRPTPPSSEASSEECHSDDEELIPMSRKALREICRGRDIQSLPEQLRLVLTGEDRHMQAVTTQLPIENHAVRTTPNPAVSGANIQQHGALDLVEPQYESLRVVSPEIVHSQAGEIISSNHVIENPTQSSLTPRQRSSQWSAGRYKSGALCLPEAGPSRMGSRPAAQEGVGRGSNQPSGDKCPPREERQKELVRIGGNLQQSFPRTLLQRSRQERPDALVPSNLSSPNMGRFLISKSLWSPATPQEKQQQTSKARLSKDGIHFQKGSTSTERHAAQDIPNSEIKELESNGATKAINEAIRLLTGEKPKEDQLVTLEEMRSSARQKRKSTAQVSIPSRPGSSKRPITSEQSVQASPIQAVLKPEGYYEIQVEQAYCGELGLKCGLKARNVEQALRDDNAERQNSICTPTAPVLHVGSDDEETPIQFDPDSADELDSEEE